MSDQSQRTLKICSHQGTEEILVERKVLVDLKKKALRCANYTLDNIQHSTSIKHHQHSS
jgi:hypothetical protein